MAGYAAGVTVEDPYLHFVDERFGSNEDVPDPTFETRRISSSPIILRRSRGGGGLVKLGGVVRRRVRIYPDPFVPFTIAAGTVKRIVFDFAIPMANTVQLAATLTLDGAGAGNVTTTYVSSSPRRLVVDLSAGVASTIDYVQLGGTAWRPLSEETEEVIDHFSSLDKGEQPGPSFFTPYIPSRGDAHGLGAYRNWRFAEGRLRPRLHVMNRTTAIAREVTDHITLTGAKSSISGKVLLIRSLEFDVAEGSGGLRWDAWFDLDEIPSDGGPWFTLGDAAKGLGTAAKLAY